MPVLGSKQDSVKVLLEEHSFFLRPTPDAEATPADDSTIRGRLVITLSKPRRVTSITVRLVCQYAVTGSEKDFRQSGQVVISNVQLQPRGFANADLPRGQHEYEFILVIPSSSAPSEKSRRGKVSYEVVATADYARDHQSSSSLANQAHATTSTSSRVRTLEDSVPVSLVINPAPLGETSKLNVDVPGFKREVGPYLFTAASQHLTVGGLIHFDYHLPNVPRTVAVLSVSAVLKSTHWYGAKYRAAVPYTRHNEGSNDDEEEGRTTVVMTPLFAIGGDIERGKLVGEATVSGDTKIVARDENGRTLAFPPSPSSSSSSSTWAHPPPVQVIPPSGSFSLSHLTRLPNDKVLPPSTLPGTRTPFRVSHELVMKLHFVYPDEEEERARMHIRSEPPYALCVTQDITISSCSCLVKSLLVPSYEEALSAGAGSTPLTPTMSTASPRPSVSGGRASPPPSYPSYLPARPSRSSSVSSTYAGSPAPTSTMPSFGYQPSRLARPTIITSSPAYPTPTPALDSSIPPSPSSARALKQALSSLPMGFSKTSKRTGPCICDATKEQLFEQDRADGGFAGRRVGYGYEPRKAVYVPSIEREERVTTRVIDLV